jgi:hypothetical protein
MKDGIRVRIERRNLATLTFGELTSWIAYRQARPTRRSEPIDDYITLHDQIAPFASSAETTVETAYREMKKAQKSA